MYWGTYYIKLSINRNYHLIREEKNCSSFSVANMSNIICWIECSLKQQKTPVPFEFCYIITVYTLYMNCIKNVLCFIQAWFWLLTTIIAATTPTTVKVSLVHAVLLTSTTCISKQYFNALLQTFEVRIQ